MTKDELYTTIISKIHKEIERAKDPYTYKLVTTLYETTKWYWDNHTGLPEYLLPSLAESGRPLHDLNEIVLFKMRFDDDVKQACIDERNAKK